MLSTAGEEWKDLEARSIAGLEGWIACFKKASLARGVLADGIYDVGAIVGHPELQKAYEMGQSIQP